MSRVAQVVAIHFFLTTSVARAAEFIPLGYLPGGFFSSSASDVSADGNVVVGQSHSANAGIEAFRWTRSTGMVGLGDFPGSDAWSAATAVSGDGSVVTGRGTAVYYAGVDAFRWTASAGIQSLGYLGNEGTLFTYASAISNDGQVIVGSSDNRIFQWSEESGIYEIADISNQSDFSGASGISADGSAIVGSVRMPAGLRPFRYSASRGFEILDTHSGVGVDSSANAISADGRVVIGYARRQGWRWDESTGLQPLPPLEESNLLVGPVDLTADGSIIVGVTTASTDPRARVPSFIWTRERGTENLQTFLKEQHGLVMDGWALTRVSGISDDGMVIVGGGVNPNGQPEAWVADLRVPEPTAFVTAILGALCSWPVHWGWLSRARAR